GPRPPLRSGNRVDLRRLSGCTRRATFRSHLGNQTKPGTLRAHPSGIPIDPTPRLRSRHRDCCKGRTGEKTSFLWLGRLLWGHRQAGSRCLEIPAHFLLEELLQDRRSIGIGLSRDPFPQTSNILFMNELIDRWHAASPALAPNTRIVNMN